jgi:hypothetical protein
VRVPGRGGGGAVSAAGRVWDAPDSPISGSAAGETAEAGWPVSLSREPPRRAAGTRTGADSAALAGAMRQQSLEKSTGPETGRAGSHASQALAGAGSAIEQSIRAACAGSACPARTAPSTRMAMPRWRLIFLRSNPGCRVSRRKSGSTMRPDAAGRNPYFCIGPVAAALESGINPPYFNSLDSRRSFSTAPPVWHPGQ